MQTSPKEQDSPEQLIKPLSTKSKFLIVTNHFSVFIKSRPVDKANFKKKNEFNAYVNSMFNSGVFTHPWQDMC